MPNDRGDFERRWHLPGDGAGSEKVYISSSELRILLNDQLQGKLHAKVDIYISDGEFYCPSIKDADEIIRRSAVDRNSWVENRFDCDDFAHVLKAHFAEAAYANGERRAAHCFGIVWGNLPGPHAINWMVNDDLKLRFIEPQSDDVFYPRSDDEDIYFMLV